MALEEIFRALESQARARCSEIRISGSEQAERVTEEAQRRCEQIVHDRIDAQAGPIESRALGVVNGARMMARRDVSAEKDRQIELSFELAGAALTDARDRETYPALMSGLLDEALASSDKPSSVLVDPVDLELARTLVHEHGLDVPVRGDITTAAGVIVLSNEDRVRHDNTAEARLARLADVARERVGEMLFG